MKDDLFGRTARLAVFFVVFLHAKGHKPKACSKKRQRTEKRENGENVVLQSFRTLLFLTALGSSPVL